MVATPACGCLTRGYVGYPLHAFVALRRFYKAFFYPVSQGCLLQGLHTCTPWVCSCLCCATLRVYPLGIPLASMFPACSPPGGAFTRVYPQGCSRLWATGYPLGMQLSLPCAYYVKIQAYAACYLKTATICLNLLVLFSFQQVVKFLEN